MFEMLTPCLSLFVIPFYSSFRLEMLTPCLSLFVNLFMPNLWQFPFGPALVHLARVPDDCLARRSTHYFSFCPGSNMCCSWGLGDCEVRLLSFFGCTGRQSAHGFFSPDQLLMYIRKLGSCCLHAGGSLICI